MLDDETSRWLLSAIIQSMAAIWAIFFALFLAFREMIIDWRKHYQADEYKPEEKKEQRRHIELDQDIKQLLLILNIFNFLAIMFGILGLYFFRTEIFIYGAVSAAVLTILILVIYLHRYIVKNL